MPVVYINGAEGVRFDEPSHAYYAPGGQWLPGCTRILADNGYSPGSEWFTDESRQRGKAVHYACQLADEACPEADALEDVLERFAALDWDLDPRLHPYLAGYLLFKREKGFVPQFHEVAVWSPTMLTAGSFDKWGRYRDGRRVMVDLKSWKSQGARPKRSAEIQVNGGYRLMAKESLGLDTDLAVVLALPGNGKYRSYDCTRSDDALVFRANAVAWWDRYNAGLIERNEASEVEMAA